MTKTWKTSWLISTVQSPAQVLPGRTSAKTLTGEAQQSTEAVPSGLSGKGNIIFTHHGKGRCTGSRARRIAHVFISGFHQFTFFLKKQGLNAQSAQAHPSDITRGRGSFLSDPRFGLSQLQSHFLTHVPEPCIQLKVGPALNKIHCVQMSLMVYVSGCWVAHKRTCVHKCHSGNYLLSQSNHMLMVAIKSAARCSPTDCTSGRVIHTFACGCLDVVLFFFFLLSVPSETHTHCFPQHEGTRGSFFLSNLLPSRTSLSFECHTHCISVECV